MIMTDIVHRRLASDQDHTLKCQAISNAIVKEWPFRTGGWGGIGKIWSAMSCGKKIKPPYH